MADIGQSLLSGYGGLGMQAGNVLGTQVVSANAGAENQANFNIASQTYGSLYNNYVNTMSPAVAQSQGLLASNSQNQAAVSQLTDLLGLGPQGASGALAALQATPGYQFQVDTGTKELQQQMNAGGLAFSGNFAQDASKYLSGLASQTYNQQLSNYENYLNQQGQLGTNTASLLQGNADIQAAGTLGVGTAAAAGTRGNLISNVGSGVANLNQSGLLGG